VRGLPPSESGLLSVETLAGSGQRPPDGKPDGAAVGSRAGFDHTGAAGPGTGAGSPGPHSTDADAAPAIRVRMIDGGIIEVLLPANQEIQGPESRIAGEAVRSLAAGRRMPVILVLTGVLGLSVEARQVYTGSIAAAAFALVGESPVDRVIAHYLLRSRGESIPAQFFTSELAAIEWLGQYVRGE
jgi:hypothetical protein